MIEFLKRCQKAYDIGKPIISDEEFDYLANKYKYYEVGAEVESDNKIKHSHKLYSLKKVYDEDPNAIFDDFIVSPKLDGAAVSLEYTDGYLVSAATRGDGEVGENIYANMSNLVPNTIHIKDAIQIVGEVVAPITIKNARNYAAGAIRLKDEEEFLTKDIIFIAYGLMGANKDTYVEDMLELKKAGFNTVVSKTWDEYPQDGLVYRVNNNAEFSKLGHTAKHPRGAFAYKKRSDVEVKKTELLDVEWQVGKGRKVTPVATFSPIEIGGATLQKATLHNAGFVEGLDLSIGDTILVTRSGGVIPKIIGKA